MQTFRLRINDSGASEGPEGKVVTRVQGVSHSAPPENAQLQSGVQSASLSVSFVTPEQVTEFNLHDEVIVTIEKVEKKTEAPGSAPAEAEPAAPATRP